MKLTEWYGYKQKPVRKGIYQTVLICDSGLIISHGIGFSKWNGKSWCDTRSSPYFAQHSNVVTRFRKMWRGVAK